MLDSANDQYSDDTFLADPVAQMIEETPQSEPAQPINIQAAPQQPALTQEQILQKQGLVVPGGLNVPGTHPQPVLATPGSYAPFLLAAVASIAGGMYAGWWGAAAGALGAGALINANRYRKAAPGPEKTQDAVFALATAGGAVYAGYQASKTKHPQR
jgi:hypothetical protein